MRQTPVYLLALIAVLGGIGGRVSPCLAQLSNNPFSPQDNSGSLTPYNNVLDVLGPYAASQLQKKLPMKLDEYTTATSVRYANGVMTFSYKLGGTADEIDSAQFNLLKADV